MATPHFLNPEAPKYTPVSRRIFFPHLIFQPSQPLYIPPISSPVYDHVYATTAPFPIESPRSAHNYTQSLPPPSVVARPPERMAKGDKYEPGRAIVAGEKYSRQRGGGRGGKREKGGWVRFVPRKYKEVVQLKQDEEKTTVMIKNIPNKYTRELLVKFLENHCLTENQKNASSEEGIVSAFDFIYLPMDFRTGVNKGYAFVNFTNPKAVWRFYNACDRMKWDLFESPKICEIVSAKLQGKEALKNHFEKSRFACETDEFLPLCFSPARDGSIASATDKLVKSSTVIGKRISIG
ncbi:hypothetical protein LguiB_007237 [Lonicera macranthoides]